MNATKVKSLIGKELWAETNATSVSINDFISSENAIKKLKTIEEKFDFKELCKEEIEDNQNPPIIPCFLFSLLGKHPNDDAYISSLFDTYYAISKYEEAEYIGNTILSFNENSYILNALADIYEKQGEIQKKIAIWNRLVKTDLNQTDVLNKLAEYYIEKGDKETALSCYKRLMQRLINIGNLVDIKNLWSVILEFDNNENYLIQVSSKIAKTLGAENGVYLLKEMLNKIDLELNSKIRILKKILDFSNNDKEALDKLIPLLREKYADNPRLDYCLADTGLLNSYMDSNIAVQKFENEIEFVQGAFVYHNTWKLGRIKKIEKDEMYIQFLKQKDLHKMSCNMAFSSLKVLPKQHILVLKAGATPEAIKKHLEDNIEWGLKMLMNSYPNGITLKQIKEELNPSILDDKGKEKAWTNWLKRAKEELSSNPYFGISDVSSDSSNDVYVLRDTPISFEEKTLGIFSRKKKFFEKYSVLKDFINQGGNTDSEEFSNIVHFFENNLNTKGFAGISSYLILSDLKNHKGIGFIKTDVSFEELYASYESMDEVKKVFGDIEDTDLKRSFIAHIIETDSGVKLNRVLTALLRVKLDDRKLDGTIRAYITENLSKRTLDNMRRDAIDNYQADPDFTLWLLRSTTDDEWKSIGVDAEALIILKLQLLLLLNSKIAHGVDSTDNKNRAKQLTDTLFTESKTKDKKTSDKTDDRKSVGEINQFLESCNTESAKRIYSYIDNIPELDENIKFSVKHFILSNRADKDEIINVQHIDLSEQRRIPKGFLCTRRMLEIKTKELDHIMNVEIPENAKQIGIAREMGDLRENAEYQYSRDKQKNLNAMMNRLSDEIDSAKVISPESVDLTYVEFGTKATFKDNKTGKEVVYSILGAWESNPEKDILNFQAPLGQKLYNMKVGENRKFEINEVAYDYTVLKIELAEF